ncbi:hypothetical protein MLD38_013553 [Melastoma candidum]|uniref:Uncharacterized protein n=1 Tax=Melastoma candidum TaxID=119954 RepID=A0ACB9R9Y0_9MYRT|nr:hypothetical protein MLD38_013553 [Melastoma candidum]
MKDDSSTPFDNSDPSVNTSSAGKNHPLSKAFSLDSQDTNAMMAKTDPLKKTGSTTSNMLEQPDQPRAADWARGLEAVTQRRTEILSPENLENMWSRGRNYKKKKAKKSKTVVQDPLFQGLSQSSTAEGHKIESIFTSSSVRVMGAYFEKLGSKSFAVYLIALDKYLQELLSIANVAEQHEVWDFLSASSKLMLMMLLMISCGNSRASQMELCAKLLVLHRPLLKHHALRKAINEYSAHEKGWHSDSDHASQSIDSLADMQSSSSQWEDPIGMPPEWTPPNVCVPLLNLVDKVFQLNRRGWLRRQIQWLRNEETISHGIRWVQDILWPGGVFFLRVETVSNLSSVVESSEEKLFQTTSQFSSSRAAQQGSFEVQLEAARRASDLKLLLLGGAPAPLVSLIGPKQYRRCARDMYYFLQELKGQELANSTEQGRESFSSHGMASCCSGVVRFRKRIGLKYD